MANPEVSPSHSSNAPQDNGSPISRAFAQAQRIFWCNTNRDGEQSGVPLETRMHNQNFAAAWIPFVFPEHMTRVRRGDLIFMYANGLGVIAIGMAAESRVEILAPDHPGRLRAFNEGEHEQEWRIPVEWLVWDDANPCVVPPLRASFQEITHLLDRVNPVRNHFI